MTPTVIFENAHPSQPLPPNLLSVVDQLAGREETLPEAGKMLTRALMRDIKVGALPRMEYTIQARGMAPQGVFVATCPAYGTELCLLHYKPVKAPTAAPGEKTPGWATRAVRGAWRGLVAHLPEVLAGLFGGLMLWSGLMRWTGGFWWGLAGFLLAGLARAMIGHTKNTPGTKYRKEVVPTGLDAWDKLDEAGKNKIADKILSDIAEAGTLEGLSDGELMDAAWNEFGGKFQVGSRAANILEEITRRLSDGGDDGK